MRTIVTTNDRSHSIQSEIYGESYHSSFGAITESKHIFITNGIEKIQKNDIAVYEAGFGTGLNAYLCMLWAAEKKVKVMYSAAELFPVEISIASKLNYSELLGDNEENFIKLHTTRWDSFEEISPFFCLMKTRTDIGKYIPDEKTDVIFFDAFSPAVQPELWNRELFSRLQKMLNQDGIFVSYCVKGTVKKALREAGFRVYVLPGPPGKRHMLYAVNDN